MKIFKYAFDGINILTSFDIPKGAKVLCAKIQHNRFTLWLEVDPSQSTCVRKFVAVPTGDTLPSPRTYISTVLDGSFVWHIYEVV